MPLTKSTPATGAAAGIPGTEILKFTLFSTLFFWSLGKQRVRRGRRAAGASARNTTPAGNKFLLVFVGIVPKGVDVELAPEVNGGCDTDHVQLHLVARLRVQ
jgi:hypothetical protein